MSTPTPTPKDQVTVLGERRDGSRVVLGTATMPPKMKAREIVHEMFGAIDEEGPNDAGMALWCCEMLIDWMAENPPKAVSAPVEPSGATLSPCAASQWQPIDTAPTDGTYILVSHDLANSSWVAHWMPVAASGYRFEQPWRSVMLNHIHIDPYARYLPPTLWMPLPAPQVDRGESSSEGGES